MALLPAGPEEDTVVCIEIGATTAWAHALMSQLLDNLGSVIRGKREALELVLYSCASGGHVLLEDVPGTGKTTLARALAGSMGGRCTRVQFTPDLLPADITGSSVFDPRDASFRFRPGPVFTHVLIADEINRASPRTQSALLEALSEGQVSSDGQTRPLEQPFLCIATQNPVELHGTFPLPEASLDRFAVRVSLGYASEQEELAILTDQRAGHPLDRLDAVTDAEGVARLRAAVEAVHLERTVALYLLRLVRRSREHSAVRLGVSTRGALTLSRLARARALHRGRDYVLPDDVQALAVPVLAHRLVMDGRARVGPTDPAEVVLDIVAATPMPR